MRVKLYGVWDQIYLTPYIKVTYTRQLNGDLELIIGWLHKQISIQI
jgi:uncharacterized protein YhjY with autotransporter beta-barrel domain